MPTIDMPRLMTLLGSARKNLADAKEMALRYEGAIQALEMLVDDLRAQAIKEAAEQDDK